ncbi:Mg-chelatase subunit ChlD [Leucobacter exalbidus]|uniref:Mg-chelatase subunit ChlD n=1 Tax=Leucobacter exalbidus TaxID=662960 RepID=A0A940T2T2_9MICO|nr:VWA domain-containing protein [Leucobacter exalbidus]MBP1325128.1 Mg-chelatase subunit ChlD [Leucobacter exalbidus]
MQGEVAAREALRAVAAVLGIEVTVTDDERWQLDNTGLRAGLGWYTSRGHSGAEAAALALLQLWEGVRGLRVSPERSARASMLGRARPELAPLLTAITRAQAAAEVTAVFPGMREALGAALHRGLPRDLSVETRRDQWLALVLAVGFGDVERFAGLDGLDCLYPLDLAERAGASGLDPLVLEEWARARNFGDARGEAVWWVLQAAPDRPALERFERAVALLSPGYERLLARDAADRGLGADGAVAPPNEGGAESQDSGPAADGAEADSAAPEPDAEDPEGTDAGEPQAPEEQPAQAPQGSEADNTEGADLFQADQTGDVTSFLDTPLPSEGALAAAFADIDAQPGESDAGDVRPGAGGGLGARGGEYAARVASLAPDIERMREVWHEVTHERVATVAAMGRRPQAEGEALDTRALADGLAQVRAGVKRPRVFLQREHRTRRTERSGNTDYVLLIDRSASMQGRPAQAATDTAIIMLEGLAAAARDIAQAEAVHGVDLELQLRTALIVFDSRAHLIKPLASGMSDDVRDDLIAAITSPQGSTNDAAALTVAAAQLQGVAEARQRRRIVFVISDGGTNDVVAAAHELRRLRAMGVSVWGIGLGNDDVRQRYAPGGSRVDDPGQLAETVSALIRRGLS